ncbi:MAG: YgiQ family radical SAM protein [Candidatus Accumulibacter phosphatis]|uniref:Fe-S OXIDOREDUCTASE n=1 Tax=Candidatus Accumulibacter phosphatis TaxID=327160 RepID=A0A5S4ETM9_9PROT|nr:MULTISPECIES: YgiQ family radical SAM protein [Candidatus Accumulibacter]MBL8400976.1 YgiQ family radical SAM protein [Accumulibacter sp.]MCC2867630.1 YgiQ family radical SAM protein [Candidatus Accumulibacter phosphatis]MCM8580445.1 YgiQ family radical SAM protein [Accumulibacter sp.]MCM8622627.1 YgiQ family radical SAM protein [Accumulibacter sp.]MCQ1550501.1 YgiQ family radical SAM protein [Candidatus Accumulibacter phosphatis]
MNTTSNPASRTLFSYRKYWASRFGTAPFLPMSRTEMDQLGWDSCDVIIVTGDAYIDHPSFGMALVGRLLEAQGFRVGIISQPDWRSAKDFRVLGKPNLFFGVTAGNMDSMVNRYTADRKPRSDDAYTPNGEANRRPDHAVVVYAQRCREAFPGSNVVIGSIEASLRRIAHYDYWSDKVRRSVLPDSKADLLIFGSAERAIVELAHRLAAGEPIVAIRDLRGTAFMVPRGWLPGDDWAEIDSSQVDTPGLLVRHPDPYAMTPEMGKEIACASRPAPSETRARSDRTQVIHFQSHPRMPKLDRMRSAIRLPSYETVAADPVLYAHASRIFHVESNPGNARALVQAHGERDVWLNPPPIPLSTPEMDGVFASPFQRRPHPSYGDAKIPAFEMIRFSVNIMRGCFGGCTFCSITEHEGRIIQSRSEQSILHEIEEIRDKTPGFTGMISDLGGPTANMYRLACKDPKIESACRRLSCVYPGICENLGTDHTPLLQLYRKARALPGVKKVLISSGLRYDLAVRDPQYVKELVSHHVGGYLKIAPEHTEDGPLAHMMKPGMSSYEQFRILFEKFSKEAGKEQYLIPYFIAAHPGTTDQDMLNLALWLKRHHFRLDQVQTFLPTPLAMATAMYHSRKNPLKKVGRDSEAVETVRGTRQRRLHKAFLRYHDPENWPLLREALKQMGRSDLIGNGRKQLIPFIQPPGTGARRTIRKVMPTG